MFKALLMDCFRLSPLRGDRILQAYPLVCAAGGDISVEEWRAYVRTMLGARAREADCCDIIGICASNGYLRGLFTYRVSPDLHHGRILEVEYFVVESVFSPGDIFAALMAGVEDEARKHGCNAIHAKTQPGAERLSEMLKDRDYISETEIWCKRSA